MELVFEVFYTLIEKTGIPVEWVLNMADAVSAIDSISNRSSADSTVIEEKLAPVSVCVDTMKPASAVTPSEEVSYNIPKTVLGNTSADADTESATLK